MKPTPRGVKAWTVTETLNRKNLINQISSWLQNRGYIEIEIPVLMPKAMFHSCTDGTENRMFHLDDDMVLIPEVTNYIRSLVNYELEGHKKIFYIAKCFRNETTTDATRLREFTQIGVEFLGENSLDCRKVVRGDVFGLIHFLRIKDSVVFDDGVVRGLNLYNDESKTFEVSSVNGGRQILGGGPYEGGAGWALGLERLMTVMGY